MSLFKFVIIAHWWRIHNMKNSYTTSIDENIKSVPNERDYDNYVGYLITNPSDSESSTTS